MRTARKRMGLTQIAISKNLGISQGALSKLESAQLVPSAPQWFEFCEMTGIAPDCLSRGYIERNRPAILESDDASLGWFKMPKKYVEFRGSKARATLIFIDYFKATLGEEKFLQYLEMVKIDPDVFVDLDNQMNLAFILDLTRTLIQQGHLKPKDMPALVKTVTRPQSHGSLHRHYDAVETSIELLTTLIRNSRQYECNFEYEIEDQKVDRMVISVKPERHLKHTHYKNDPMLGNFLCQYKQSYFERFAYYNGGKGVTLHENECHYKGAEKCIYSIKTAA